MSPRLRLTKMLPYFRENPDTSASCQRTFLYAHFIAVAVFELRINFESAFSPLRHVSLPRLLGSRLSFYSIGNVHVRFNQLVHLDGGIEQGRGRSDKTGIQLSNSAVFLTVGASNASDDLPYSMLRFL